MPAARSGSLVVVAVLLVAGVTVAAGLRPPEAATGAVAAATGRPTDTGPPPSSTSARSTPTVAPAGRSPQPSESPDAPGGEPSPTDPPRSQARATASPRTKPSHDPAIPPPSAGPFQINLYRPGDFTSQATKDQCVSAAMQTMLNVVLAEQDRSSRTQAALAEIATGLSDAPDGGSEPRGWARGLVALGAGRYRVAVAMTRSAAIREAVTALRATGRPVGLLVWRGAHSWVLHGFRSTADPARTERFRITGLYISDPWYPRVSSIWGASRPPNSIVDPARLVEDYLPWARPTGRYPGMDGRFVLVLPVGDR
jgi:hypothetical protein